MICRPATLHACKSAHKSHLQVNKVQPSIDLLKSAAFTHRPSLRHTGNSSTIHTLTMPRPIVAARAVPSLSALPLAPLALLGLAGVVSAWAFIDAKLKEHLPKIQLPKTADKGMLAFWEKVLAQCSTLQKVYKPVPFLTNPHVETIFASKFRKAPTDVEYLRECLLMADGGCVALDWQKQAALPEDAPILILLPGLTGGSHDSYVMYAARSARQAGMRVVVFNSRGTCDSPVTTPQYYSASFTGDMRAITALVHNRYPQAPLLAAGWSLGANILVRYLGEEGEHTPISAAVSMVNPFNLTISNQHLTRGFNNIYDINLANSLSKIHSKHHKLWKGMQPPFKPDVACASKTIREFDDAITIHSFGWPSVDEYYAGSSSSLSIPHVKVPLLCIQALDDPIAPAEAIPYQALSENPNTVLVTVDQGGHLGWTAGPAGPTHAPWSDTLMTEWLVAVNTALTQQRQGPPPKKPVVQTATVLGSSTIPVAVLANGVTAQ